MGPAAELDRVTKPPTRIVTKSGEVWVTIKKKRKSIYQRMISQPIETGGNEIAHKAKASSCPMFAHFFPINDAIGPENQETFMPSATPDKAKVKLTMAAHPNSR